jgi:tripartite-type tricarboxylate transporter receptor subunit TctC
MHRRHFLHLALMTAAAPASLAAPQPARIVLPFAAGGPADALARVMAEHMSESLGAPVVVENKPGAAGRLGVQAVKMARADGTTLLFTPIAPMVVYPHVYKSLGYDPFEDFRPVAQITTFDFGVAVSPAVPATSLAELVAWLQRNPKQASFGSPGAGTLPHLFGALFGRSAGLDLQHVAYKGMGDLLPDLMSGQIPMMFLSTDAVLQVHRTGRVRALATSGIERSPVLPDVPTFREAGYPIEGSGWHGFFVPAKTPDEVVEILNKAIVSATRKPEAAERIRGLGLRPTGTSAQEFASIQRRDSEFWAKAVKAAGFTAEE